MGGRGRGPKLLHFPKFPGYFFLCFSFDKPTARTAWDISVVYGSSNVVPCKVVAFGVQIHIRVVLVVIFPKNPHFWPIFSKSQRFASCTLGLRYRPNLLTKFHWVGLKLLPMTKGTTFSQNFSDLWIRGRLSPPKQQILGVLCTGKKWKNHQFSTFLNLRHIYIKRQLFTCTLLINS